MQENHFVLYRNSNGVYYYYIYRYGKRLRRSTGEKTKKKALDVALMRIGYSDLDNEARHRYITFGKYASDFWNYETCPIIQNKIKRGGRYTIKHANRQQGRVNSNMMPYFKSKVLQELTPAMIESWLFMLAETLSNKTVNDCLNCMRLILDQAIAEGYLTTNVARSVKPLIVNSVRRGCFTVEQIKEIFSADWENDIAYTMCYLSAHTGMRLGEIRALKPEQIHKDYIEVNASYSREDGRKCTKSGYSRIVPINSIIYGMLEKLVYDEDSYIFRSTEKDVPFTDRAVEQNLKHIMKILNIDAEKLKLTFHSFRHFFNSRLIASGLHGEEVRAIIGHESEDMTMHYLHLSPSDMDNIRQIQFRIDA